MLSYFDNLIRAGRDTEAVRMLAKELYNGGKMGHTRKLLLERVADKLDKAEAEVERLQTLLETFNGECVVCDSVSEITKAQAEADGRLVELPCRVGDTVWVIASCEDVAKSCDDDYFNGTGEITCPYENTCEIEECADDNIRVFETSINCVVIEEDGKFTFWVDTLLISFGVSEIGKTVFLTREEAEAAHLCSEFEDAMDALQQAIAELED